jgi:two-component system chemotaxis response regulator CheY
MPVMDGLTMIRQLRQRPAGAGVPIIFLTTESDADVKAQAKAAGATGWLTKPFDPDQLVRVVQKVLAK